MPVIPVNLEESDDKLFEFKLELTKLINRFTMEGICSSHIAHTLGCYLSYMAKEMNLPRDYVIGILDAEIKKITLN